MNTTLATFLQAAATVLILSGLIIGITYLALDHANTKQQDHFETRYQIKES